MEHAKHSLAVRPLEQDEIALVIHHGNLVDVRVGHKVRLHVIKVGDRHDRIKGCNCDMQTGSHIHRHSWTQDVIEEGLFKK